MWLPHLCRLAYRTSPSKSVFSWLPCFTYICRWLNHWVRGSAHSLHANWNDIKWKWNFGITFSAKATFSVKLVHSLRKLYVIETLKVFVYVSVLWEREREREKVGTGTPEINQTKFFTGELTETGGEYVFIFVLNA